MYAYPSCTSIQGPVPELRKGRTNQTFTAHLLRVLGSNPNAWMVCDARALCRTRVSLLRLAAGGAFNVQISKTAPLAPNSHSRVYWSSIAAEKEGRFNVADSSTLLPSFAKASKKHVRWRRRLVWAPWLLHVCLADLHLDGTS